MLRKETKEDLYRIIEEQDSIIEDLTHFKDGYEAIETNLDFDFGLIEKLKSNITIVQQQKIIDFLNTIL